jgi:hypothetical protein
MWHNSAIVHAYVHRRVLAIRLRVAHHFITLLNLGRKVSYVQLRLRLELKTKIWSRQVSIRHMAKIRLSDRNFIEAYEGQC